MNQFCGPLKKWAQVLIDQVERTKLGQEQGTGPWEGQITGTTISDIWKNMLLGHTWPSHHNLSLSSEGQGEPQEGRRGKDGCGTLLGVFTKPHAPAS